MTKLLSSLALSATNPGAFGAEVYQHKNGAKLESFSPIDNSLIASVHVCNSEQYEQIISDAQAEFLRWREMPAPKRGEVVRQIAEELRKNKQALGELITLETGKILAEGLGEVQEAIDIADFAVGLSRQLCGQSMHSERAQHRMYEQWHPLGVVGVITAFNFPMAVWAWNSMLATVCGDTIVWKPSEHTPICALAINNLCRSVAERHGFRALFNLIIGDGPQLGKQMAEDKRIPLISATGSTRMGRSVAEVVGRRLGRTILELGGNNAVIVLKDADIELAVRAVLFGAVGTAGQRCTSTRRLLVEKGIEEQLSQKLLKAYKQVKIGDPRQSGILMGPLINKAALQSYQAALKLCQEQGGEIIYGGEILESMPSDLYVAPTIVKAKPSMSIVKEETFAPILYMLSVNNLEEALELNNSVPQGLSSAIFSSSLKSSEKFLSQLGSDCGIANVNIGTSGAEIGGAFGGEKDTGGGRESGSDSWKQYMRRQTNTINWGDDLPLAQGISFDI